MTSFHLAQMKNKKKKTQTNTLKNHTEKSRAYLFHCNVTMVSWASLYIKLRSHNQWSVKIFFSFPLTTHEIHTQQQKDEALCPYSFNSNFILKFKFFFKCVFFFSSRKFWKLQRDIYVKSKAAKKKCVSFDWSCFGTIFPQIPIVRVWAFCCCCCWCRTICFGCCYC